MGNSTKTRTKNLELAHDPIHETRISKSNLEGKNLKNK
jgi:hypothetical protein